MARTTRVDNITKVLKGFVIAGGIVLIAGTALLVALIVMRASGDPPNAGPEGPGSPGAAAGSSTAPHGPDPCADGSPSSQPVSVAMPAGARIEQIIPDGRCLIMLGTDGDGRQFVALVDPLSGERISLLLIYPEP